MLEDNGMIISKCCGGKSNVNLEFYTQLKGHSKCEGICLKLPFPWLLTMAQLWVNCTSLPRWLQAWSGDSLWPMEIGRMWDCASSEQRPIRNSVSLLTFCVHHEKSMKPALLQPRIKTRKPSQAEASLDQLARLLSLQEFWNPFVKYNHYYKLKYITHY